jgi:hypothetical protein
MHLLNKSLTYLALLIIFVAVLTNFDGTVNVEATSSGLQVRVNNDSAKCPIKNPSLHNKKYKRKGYR